MSENIYDINMILKLKKMCSLIDELKVLMAKALGDEDE